ncbi:MAG: hypothetical protein ON057_001683 [Glomeribacter sp. 1016415]|nr:hypothetical protein [Glomeribacter sp. 1016415]
MAMSFDSVFFILILGAMVAGFVQGLSGFAFGMVSMSFWAWVLEPQLVIAMTVFGGLTGQLLAVTTVRRALNLPLLLPFLIGGLIGIPIGVAILPYLNVSLLKTILGCLLIVWCPIMLLKDRLPPFKLRSRLADSIVGGLGGIMGGLGGFAGALPTLWCMLSSFDKNTQRAVIQNFNLSILAATMVSYIATGVVTRSMLPMFAVVAVAMLIPTLIGARLYRGIDELTFRKIVLGLLTFSGVALLVSVWV